MLVQYYSEYYRIRPAVAYRDKCDKNKILEIVIKTQEVLVYQAKEKCIFQEKLENVYFH